VSAEKPAVVGDVIQPGEDIPGNAIKMRDADGDVWECDSLDRWRTADDGGEMTPGNPLRYGPLTVTAVRDEPGRQAIPCPDKTPHEAHTHRGFAAPEGVPPSNCPGIAAAQQVAEPPLLDLVREYGDIRSWGMALVLDENATSEDVQRNNANSRALFDRIAEALAQQPVQAHDNHGDALWIHGCGHVSAITAPQADLGHLIQHRDCETGVDGPWRPLLVATDPAPPATADDQQRVLAYLDRQNERMTDELIKTRDERDVARAALARHTDEDGSPLPTDAELDIRITEVTREREYWKRRFEEQAARGDEDAQRILTLHAKVERLKAAHPNPLVLTLPKVPEGAVALVGVESGRRWTLYRGPLADRSPRQWQHGSMIRGDQSIFSDEYDGVRVEMAPPPKPRTVRDNVDDLRNWINLAAEQKHWEYDEAVYCLDRIEEALTADDEPGGQQ
jgi:hypothetical protein